MKRHQRENYYVLDEGILTFDRDTRPIRLRPSTAAALRKFRFSRLGQKGTPLDRTILEVLGRAMTQPDDTVAPDSQPGIPAGYTYLAQFVDHDLTLDRTAAAFGEQVTVDELLQGRSPALDLDSLYGAGPGIRGDRRFYAADGAHLLTGTTAGVGGGTTSLESQPHAGFDLPRVGFGPTKRDRRRANIPDARNDENLAVAQTHLAFIRFHNRVVDDLIKQGFAGPGLFATARDTVVKHYQWMLRTDFLPRIVDPAIVDDVFANGRRFFDVHLPYEVDPSVDDYLPKEYVQAGDTPTMPIEFSVAAFRMGHSMVRSDYEWNRVFNSNGFAPGSLGLLFRFCGTSGTLSPGRDPADFLDPDSGDFETLPSNWIADFRRLYDFREAGREDLVPPEGGPNLTKRIDTLLANPLKELPHGSFGGRDHLPLATDLELNLAFRNLMRATMVSLASGQQMARQFGVKELEAPQILTGGAGGVNLVDAANPLLDEAQSQALVANTPLWFYALREAELNGGLLSGVGGRIVAEVFHRTMEGSQSSIVREPDWTPYLGRESGVFRMVDLLLALDGDDQINKLG